MASSIHELPGGPWVRTWLLASASVALYLGFVLASSLPVFADPTSIVARLQQIEQQSLARSESPKVLFLGSSRAAFSVVPDQIDADLGLPSRSTVNAGYPGGGEAMFKLLLDRNGQLTRTPLVFIFTDEYFLFEAERPSEPPSDLTPAERSELWLSASLGAYTNLGERLAWPKKFLMDALGLQPCPTLSVWSVDEEGCLRDPAMMSNERMLDPSSAQSMVAAIAKSYYGNRKISRRGIQVYEELCTRLRDAGCRVVLLHMPTHALYSKFVLDNYGDLYQEHRREFTALAQRVGVPFYFYEHVEQCNLTAAHYYDPVHLTHEGSRQFSCFLASLIRNEQLLTP